MIPDVAVEMTSLLAPFGAAALVAVGVGLIAVLSAAVRERVASTVCIADTAPDALRPAA